MFVKDLLIALPPLFLNPGNPIVLKHFYQDNHPNK
jgi:hypothetical protein